MMRAGCPRQGRAGVGPSSRRQAARGPARHGRGSAAWTAERGAAMRGAEVPPCPDPPCRTPLFPPWPGPPDERSRACHGDGRLHRLPSGPPAAGGRVLKVRLTSSTSRWAFGGAGNHITILHPNGVVTTYGHIATSFVNPGDEVSQGQIIALIGGQPGTPGAGRSTACHLHFGVSGAKNPFAR